VRLDHVACPVVNVDDGANADTITVFSLGFSPAPKANDLFQ